VDCVGVLVGDLNAEFLHSGALAKLTLADQ